MKNLPYAVSPTLFGKIKNTLEGENFPWYYTATTAYTSNDKQFEELHNGSFGHIAYNEKKNSEISDFLEAALYEALDKMSITLKHLHRIRIGFIPISPELTINPPHIDIIRPHKVGLLYLNDSDGDTIIYNEKFEVSSENIRYKDHRDSVWFYENVLKKQVTPFCRIQPQENKFVTFDGLHYHSSCTPVHTKRRIVVNYVYESND